MSDRLLQEVERQELEGLANQTDDLGLSRRARLLLLYDDGLPTLQAAAGSGLSRGRARFWKRQFKARGMGIFSRDLLETATVVIEQSPEVVELLTMPAEEPALELSLPIDEMTEAPEPEVKMDLAEFTATAKELTSPGVLPDDPLAEAGRKVWRYHFAQMLLHEEGTLLGENIEELHDMRVATRRMRAAFDVFNVAFTGKALKRHLKGLRQTGRTLGRVRDLDVFIDKARRYQKRLDEEQHQSLDPLLAAWVQERELARAEMIGYLNSHRYSSFKERFYAFLSTPGAGALPRSLDLPMPYLVREAAPVLIYDRLGAVRAYDAILPQASLEQFHALRIEFKKLRYTLEYFREVLGESAKEVITEIKGLQDHLGDLNDANVAAGILRDFLARWDTLQAEKPVAERHGPEPVLAYLTYQYEERQRLMLSFKASWERFNRPDLRRSLAKAVAVL